MADRRGVLKGLLISSFAITATRLTAQTAVQKRTDGEQVATFILRFLNTLQLWYRKDSGEYGNFPSLLKSDALRRMLADERLEDHGIGRSLFSRLSLETKEVVRGWELTLAVSEDRNSYLLVIKEPKTGLALSTDEQGMIFYGTLSARAFRRGYLPTASEALVQEGSRSVGRFLETAYSRTIGFMAASCCCTDPRCPCAGTCQDMPVDMLCENCGCAPCVWCCVPY
jgi:hypothetical protein